jgi:hypothetical protein
LLAAGSSAARTLQGKSEDLIGKVREAEKNPNLPEQVDVDYPEQVKSAFIDVPPAGREPRWFSFKRPYVLRRAEFTFPTQAVHDKPSLRIEKSTVGLVSLSWAPSENNQNIEVHQYSLSRKDGEDGRWLELKKFDAGTTSFEDRTVRPRMAYFYRVTSYARATEPGARFSDPELTSLAQRADIPFNMKFDMDNMMSGVDASGNRFIRTTVAIIQPDGTEVSESMKLELGKKIKVKGTETDWMLKDFGDKKFVLLVNSNKEEVRIPEEKAGEPAPPEPPGEPGDDEAKKEPEPPKEPPAPPKDPGGGGWLPGDGK